MAIQTLLPVYSHMSSTEAWDVVALESDKNLTRLASNMSCALASAADTQAWSSDSGLLNATELLAVQATYQCTPKEAVPPSGPSALLFKAGSPALYTFLTVPSARILLVSVDVSNCVAPAGKSATLSVAEGSVSECGCMTCG